ncbi:MAG: 4Fe-4S dicluster domain-containing protein [Coriobacteriaceae bacterium]|jgi:succinate dehydrogenase/fumarate reductase iron-sulfur protein|nr:4Fe-4S dicluster domain-containing protein [Coriobacteriaceae bacterium]
MKLRIQKYNPQVDAAPYYVEGEVAFREGITALDAVYLFHTEIEPVNFDYACGGRICGRCGAMVDGEPKLMCFALLDDSTHTLEPLKGFDVIRDLVVDKSEFDRRIAEADVRIMLEPVTEETAAPADFNADEHEANYDLMMYLERCARCGLCTVKCPALQLNKENYVGAAEMIQIAFKDMDWYDKGDRIAQAVGSGLYRCIRCGVCDEVCTQQVPHLKIWAYLRAKAEARGLVPSYAV